MSSKGSRLRPRRTPQTALSPRVCRNLPMASGAGAVFTTGCRRMAERSVVGAGCVSGSSEQEAAERRAPDYRLCPHAPADGTRPDTPLARQPCPGEAISRGFREISVLATAQGASRPARCHPRGAAFADVEPGFVRLCRQFRRSRRALSGLCAAANWSAFHKTTSRVFWSARRWRSSSARPRLRRNFTEPETPEAAWTDTAKRQPPPPPTAANSTKAVSRQRQSRSCSRWPRCRPYRRRGYRPSGRAGRIYRQSHPRNRGDG